MSTNQLPSALPGDAPLARALATMEKMKERIAQLERAAHEPIAVIGIGARFPGGGRGVEALWKLWLDGTDAVSAVPPERWDAARYFDREAGRPGKMYTDRGSFLDDVDAFDAELFGISPREAVSMDPQQRIFLETCWEAMEHAGLSAAALEGSQTGVYAGIVNLDYAMMQMKDTAHAEMDTYFATGHPHCVVSGRVAYQLGLRGPTLSVDTACSSSLVALHLACKALRNRECEMAFAGGINLLLMPEIYMIRCQARMLSPSGRCATFDAGADGYIPGEGCGVLLLKRLSDAVRDGDRIDAVLRGTHINQDGRSNGLTVPNGNAQREVLRAALRDAGLDARRVGYLEAHGTGTKLGDPIEMEALQDVYCQRRDEQEPLFVGSAKTNFGHLESAAGICGVIKAVLAVQRGVIPPHLHFSSLNPHIELHPATKIPTEAVAWSGGAETRCAAVSSFGMSGTNAHVIVEEAPRRASSTANLAVVEDAAVAQRPRVVMLSAQQPEALQQLAGKLRAHLSDETVHPLTLDAVVETLHRRSRHRHRLALHVSSLAELRECLELFLADTRDPRWVVTGERSLVEPKVVFVFPGQGSQWLHMGCRLLDREPQCAEYAEFADELRRADAAIQRAAGWSVLAELRADAATSRLDRVEVIQPCIFAVQIALARLWRSWGVEPAAVIGHSMGEVAAAYVVGALSLDDAALIITTRSALAKATSGNGAMALVELSPDDAERAIARHRAEVGVAAINGPKTVLISGAPAPVAEILRELEARDVFCRAVKVDYASHSPQMDRLREPLRRALSSVAPRDAAIAFYSTVTDRVEDGRGLDADYWVNNLRQPVRFWPAIERLVEDEHNVFLEISPHPVLVPTMTQGLRQLGATALPLASLHRDRPEEESLFEARASYLCAGGELRATQPRRGGPALALPTAPLTQQRFWYTPSAAGTRASSTNERGDGRLLQRSWRMPGQRVWEGTLSLELMPSLTDHRVNGMLLFPGAGYVELLLEAGAALAGDAAELVPYLEVLEIHSGLVLRDDGQRVVQVALRDEGERTYRFTIDSRDDASADEPWTRHADGELRLTAPAPVATTATPPAATLASLSALDGDEHYARTRERGLEYGPAYRAVAEVGRAPGEARATLQLPEAISAELDGCAVHPSLLDAAFQLIDPALATAPSDPARPGEPLVEAGQVYLPAALRGLRLHARPGGRSLVPHTARLALHAAQPLAPAALAAHFELLDEHGAPLLSAEHFEIRRAGAANPAWEGLPSEWFYRLRWQPHTLAPAAAREGEHWMIFADDAGLGAALADRLAAADLRVTIVRRSDITASVDLPALFARHAAAPPARLLYLWGLDAPTLHQETAELAPALPETEALVTLVQALSASSLPPPRLWIITANALPFESERPAPMQAPLWAVARVLEYEHPEHKTISCDLDGAPGNRHLDQLTAALLAATTPDQLRISAEVIQEARLARFLPPAEPPPPLQLRDDATYLITGGLGGLGLEVAKKLVDHGVRHLALLGRSRPSAAAERTLADLEARGVTIHRFAADVARRDQLAAIFAELSATAAPLRGVVHCAGVLRDGALLTLDRDAFRAVLESKLSGAWNLHALTRELPLDHFILFSSLTAMLGGPGQANYSAANAFLDGLAAHRRHLGLPALTLQWGAFAEVGLAAVAERRGDRLSDSGIPAISPRQGMKALEMALRWSEPTLGVFPFPFLLWRRLNPQIAKNTLFAEIGAESRYRPERAATSSLAAELAAADPAARRQLLSELLRRELARVLKISVEQLRPGATFKEMGFDSLIAIELRNRLEAALAISLSATMVWRYPTFDELITYLAQSAAGEAIAPTPNAARQATAPRWLVREAPRAAPRLRLLCFPHGGAGASAFQGWSALFPDDVEILTFQPPGREERLAEEPERSMAAYAGAICDELAPLLDVPFAVFGYSLGGLTGFATLAELRRRTGKTPAHLVVSSCFAPHIPFAETTLARVSTQQSALQAMTFYQSAPDSLFRDPEMAALLQRSMDADNSVVESYRYAERERLACPITVYAGRTDDLAPVDEQARWRELTSQAFELRLCDGDHFFFLRDKTHVMDELRRLLAEIPQ